MMVVLLALEQVSANSWTQAHSVCFPLSVMGAKSRVEICPWEPGNGAQRPGRAGMSLASSL